MKSPLLPTQDSHQPASGPIEARHALPLIDQERELRIQAEGLLLRAEMLAWERTGDFGAHGAATRHCARQSELIKGRSEYACAWLAAQKGLPA